MDKPNQPDSDRHLSVSADPETSNVTLLPDLQEQSQIQPQRSGTLRIPEGFPREASQQLLVLSPHPDVVNMRALVHQQPGARIGLAGGQVTSIAECNDAVNSLFVQAVNISSIFLLLVVHVNASGQLLLNHTIVQESDFYKLFGIDQDYQAEFIYLCLRDLTSYHLATLKTNANLRLSSGIPGRVPSLGMHRIEFDMNEAQLSVSLNPFLASIVTLNQLTVSQLFELLKNVIGPRVPQDCLPQVVSTVVNHSPQLLDPWLELLDMPEDEQQDDSPLRNVEQLPKSSELDQGEPLAVGVLVESYSKAREKNQELKDRLGCKFDLQYCKKIAKSLGCSNPDIHILYRSAPDVDSSDTDNFSETDSSDNYDSDTDNSDTNNHDTGRRAIVKKNNVDDHIKKIIENPANQSQRRIIFLFISAHGRPDGFVDSKGEIISLGDLVKKLQTIASHVTVFYQACRGKNEHFVDKPSTLDGLCFPRNSTAGSSLPWNVPGCSAIFASCPGYKAYSNKDSGSLFLQALKEALKKLQPTHQANLSDLSELCNLRLLAEEVQKTLIGLLMDRFGREHIKKIDKRAGECTEIEVKGQIQYVLLPL